MSRSLTVQKKLGILPWRAHPGPETTIAELEAAVSMLKLDVLRTTDDEILLVQTDEAIREQTPPPFIEELALVMFGDDADEATLVEETGQFTKPTVEEFEAQSFEDEARDRNAEGA